jgi:uncharacterized protein
MRIIMTKPLVIYHYPCVDGFTAAWTIWLAHPDWEFYPAKHGEPAPDVTGREVVYMVDFSYKRPVILEMAKQVDWIYIIDHHKTAQADLIDLPDNVTIVFDMEKSGARLAWEDFHHDKPVPEIVKYVEDRDLWRFAYPETESINAYIFSQSYDFAIWSYLDGMLASKDTKNHIISLGDAITQKHHKDVQELSANKFRGRIGGHEVWIVNVPYTLASDMGHLLGKGEPFAASYFYDGTGFVYSLRSDENGLDVGEIAKKYGGGGHKHAAGFKIKVNPEVYFGELKGIL